MFILTYQISNSDKEVFIGLIRSYQFEQNKYDNDILTVDIYISIHKLLSIHILI